MLQTSPNSSPISQVSSPLKAKNAETLIRTQEVENIIIGSAMPEMLIAVSEICYPMQQRKGPKRLDF